MLFGKGRPGTMSGNMHVDTADMAPLDLAGLRSLFLDRVWVGLLVVASLGVPLSLSRTFFTGWQPAFAVQFLLLIVLGLGYVLRGRFSFRVRALTIVALLDGNGIAAVLSFGIFGASWWWLFMSSLLVAMCFRTRAGLVHAVCAMVVLGVVAAGFVQGWLSLAFDANAYSREFLPWASMFSGPVLFTVFVFWACDAFLKGVPDTARREL